MSVNAIVGLSIAGVMLSMGMIVTTTFQASTNHHVIVHTMDHLHVEELLVHIAVLQAVLQAVMMIIIILVMFMTLLMQLIY